jgi:hypothetical protein
MPLAGEEGGVTPGFERLGESCVRGCQFSKIRSGPQRAVFHLSEFPVFSRIMVFRQALAEKLVGRAKIIGVAGAGRPLAGHDRRAGRRTHRTCGVSRCELHSGVSQRLKRRSIVKCGRIVGGNIHHPEVVGDDQHDIGRRACVGEEWQASEPREQEGGTHDGKR